MTAHTLPVLQPFVMSVVAVAMMTLESLRLRHLRPTVALFYKSYVYRLLFVTELNFMSRPRKAINRTLSKDHEVSSRHRGLKRLAATTSVIADASFSVASAQSNQIHGVIPRILNIVHEGLSVIDPVKSNIANNYIERDGGSSLLEIPIRPSNETGKTAIASSARNDSHSWGYFLKVPLSIRIENCLPIVRIREQTKTFIADCGIALSLPEFSVEFSPEGCDVTANQTEQACELPPYARLVADTTSPLGITE